MVGKRQQKADFEFAYLHIFEYSGKGRNFAA
jgi:hypothetical protein